MLEEMSKTRDLFRLKDAQGRNPLHLVAYTGYHDAVSFMLDNFPNSALEHDGAGYFPIHIAGKMGHVIVIFIMLRKCRYDPTELLTENGQNILHISAQYERTSSLIYILTCYGLHELLNQKDEDGNTPLHLAAMHFQPLALFLLTWKRGIDVELVNHDCLTALDAAVERLERVDKTFQQVCCSKIRKIFSLLSR